MFPSPSRSRRCSASTAVRANRLLFDGGKLSGSVEDPIVDAQAKRDALIEAREELGLAGEDVLAIGDGANDRLMVEEAGLGVAFRAKPALAEVADARLDHHGLDALLWAQGIRRRDWVRLALSRGDREAGLPSRTRLLHAAAAASCSGTARPGAG